MVQTQTIKSAVPKEIGIIAILLFIAKISPPQAGLVDLDRFYPKSTVLEKISYRTIFKIKNMLKL
jgi:hypothetical protein